MGGPLNSFLYPYAHTYGETAFTLTKPGLHQAGGKLIPWLLVIFQPVRQLFPIPTGLRILENAPQLPCRPCSVPDTVQSWPHFWCCTCPIRPDSSASVPIALTTLPQSPSLSACQCANHSELDEPSLMNCSGMKMAQPFPQAQTILSIINKNDLLTDPLLQPFWKVVASALLILPP